LDANALNQNEIEMNIFPAAPKIASPHLPWPWGVSQSFNPDLSTS